MCTQLLENTRINVQSCTISKLPLYSCPIHVCCVHPGAQIKIQDFLFKYLLVLLCLEKAILIYIFSGSIFILRSNSKPNCSLHSFWDAYNARNNSLDTRVLFPLSHVLKHDDASTNGGIETFNSPLHGDMDSSNGKSRTAGNAFTRG